MFNSLISLIAALIMFPIMIALLAVFAGLGVVTLIVVVPLAIVMHIGLWLLGGHKL